MLAAMKMLGGVLVLRRITTAHVSAFKTQAQMDPAASSFHAVFANVGIGAGELNLIEVSTLFHDFPRSSIY